MNIRLVCFDFDGVFTNGKIYLKNNILNKYYDIKDGMGLSLLRKNNIKYGLITGFKNKNYMINDENINKIIEHLKFDYVKFGAENKLEVLDEWIIKENITYNNVAYIGDDINDINIMENVAFSACPYDARDICKDIVNYICIKNGGDGCVREFIDKILNLKENPYQKIINQIKHESNYQLNNINLNDIIDIADIIQNKLIYCTGVGKSENIAMHCANLLKSIGMKAFYLDCLNSVHGDIGTISKNDIILIFSKSGNTSEIINIIPSLKLHKPYLISISCNKDGILNKVCDKSVILPLQNEINGSNSINNIPTNSYMSMLYFVNILTMIMIDKNNLSLDKYKLNHPGGNIGLTLMTINDIMIINFPKIILNNEIHLSEILLEMTKYSIGCCFFINQNNELIGLLSDGDIRRLLCFDRNLDIIKKENINTKFYYETDRNKMLYDVKNIKKYKFIPILENNKLIGIIKN
jgi:arabinose-5-phosphate isomerase